MGVKLPGQRGRSPEVTMKTSPVPLQKHSLGGYTIDT